MTEHNQNGFAADTAADEPATAPVPIADDHAAPPDDPPSALDFDPVEVSSRCDGWTPSKQCEFIEELADCGIVAEAAARVGMTARSANRLRRRADAAGFNLAWEAAVRLGVDRLRSIAYERAVTGTVTPRFYRGEKIGEVVAYDNRLLLSVIGRAEPLVDEYDVKHVIEEWEPWMESIRNGTEPPPIPEPETEQTGKVMYGEIRRIIVESDGTHWDCATNSVVRGTRVIDDDPRSGE